MKLLPLVTKTFTGALVAVLAACAPAPAPEPSASPAPTLVPTATPLTRPTLPPANTAQPTPNVSPTPTPILIDPLTGVRTAPPLTLDLPEGWRFGYDTIIFEDVGDLTYVPIALYKGPVTGGTGTIVLVWNFRSVTSGIPQPDSALDSAWIDGLRLLRGLVFDAECNIGTDPQRDFSVGGRPATGTNFRVVDCPETADTKGWFAGLTVEGVNFIFYMYTDPIDAMKDSVPFELQAILDSIRFEIPPAGE
jgi:hypothetical protein